MDNYQKITEFLKNNPPLLENPQALTHNILTEIIRREKTLHKRLIFRFSAYISGIAAILLLCLMISQSVFSEKINLQNTDNQFIVNVNISEKKIIAQKIEKRQKERQLLAIYYKNRKY